MGASFFVFFYRETAKSREDSSLRLSCFFVLYKEHIKKFLEY